MDHGDVKWFPLEKIEMLERAISDVIHSENEKEQRFGILMGLGLEGLRATEATNSCANHFEPMHGRLFVCPWVPPEAKMKIAYSKIPRSEFTCRALKHGRTRTIRLSQTLVDAIMRHRDQYRHKSSDDWLLPNSRGGRVCPVELAARARALLISLGMMRHKSTKYHMLRHTCAMRILAKTKDLMLVQRQLGHSDPKTTQIYAKCLDQVPCECLVTIYDRAEPMPGQQFQLFNPFGEAS